MISSHIISAESLISSGDSELISQFANKKPSIKKKKHRMGYSIPNSQTEDKSPAGSRKQDSSR